jgi:hypothetical protein
MLRSFLERAVCKVNDLYLLDDTVQALDERLVGGVMLDIVLPVLNVLELHDKGMGDAILRTRQQVRLGCIVANSEVTDLNALDRVIRTARGGLYIWSLG